jgi:hypothetical protein
MQSATSILRYNMVLENTSKVNIGDLSQLLLSIFHKQPDWLTDYGKGN